MKTLVLFLFVFVYVPVKATDHLVTIKNSTAQPAGFVKYDAFGNYQHFQVAPGKTITIPVEYDYLNIFSLENDRNVPYFFFPGDITEITGINDSYYSFDSKDLVRRNELALSRTLFITLQQKPVPDIHTPLLLKQTRHTVDSIFSASPTQKLSGQYKELNQLYYLYAMLGEKIKFNARQHIQESFDTYWQPEFNHALQSYITSFRIYTLSYLTSFTDKELVLQHYAGRFGGQHKEIAMYTLMHMAYYRDKPWFRQHVDNYLSLSKDKNFSEKLSYFKLTDEISNNAEAVTLINAAKDTISFTKVVAQLKGRVVLIDLWASWCSPCIEQFLFSHELSSYFSTKDFQVLYLNVDREFHLFTNAAEKYLKGELNYNLIKNFDSPFARLNKVSAIPRYMLIDKKGNIVNNQAPLPSDEQLKILIEKYL